MPLLDQMGKIAFKNTVSVLNYVPRFQFYLRVFFCFCVGIVAFVMGIFRLGFKRSFLTRVNRSKFKVPEFVNELGTHSTFTTKEGIKLHMVVKGNPKNPTILFVHGFPDCWLSWKNQVQYFAQNGYRCVALSTRGYVDSSKSGDVQDFLRHKLVDDVKDTIDFLGVQKVILVGHDWGGSIVGHFAETYPDMVEKLIVLNCGIRPVFSRLMWTNPKQFARSWYIFFFQVPYLPELMLKLGDYFALEVLFKKELENDLMSEEELGLRKFYLSQPGAMKSMINYYRGGFQDANKNSLTRREFRIKVPSKFIWGEADKFLIVENLDGLDKYIDDVTVVRLPGVGHFIQLEAPDEVNREILNFID